MKHTRESIAIMQAHYLYLRTEMIYQCAAVGQAVETNYPADHDDPLALSAAISELTDLLNRHKALTTGLVMPEGE
jgi:hypothetical protein